MNVRGLGIVTALVLAASLSAQDRQPDLAARHNPDGSNPFEIKVITPPILSVSGHAQPYVVPDLPFQMEVTYGNSASTPAEDVVLAVDAGVQVLRVPPQCVIESASHAVCYVGEVGFGTAPPLTFELQSPLASDFTVTGTVAISASNGPTARGDLRTSTYPTSFVENTGDSGPGSLRTAVEWANTSACRDAYKPCLIAFRIPPGASNWHTISLASPLPRLIGRHPLVDGTTQTAYFGDTNPAGPEIEITGVHLDSGDGFELEPMCGASISGLAINGFPGNGVLALPGTGDPVFLDVCSYGNMLIEKNYIGTDPAGRRSVPNLRGVWVDMGTGWSPHIFENVISGNALTGIYAVSAYRARIAGNRIGLNAPLTAGLGNGASGIYIHPSVEHSEIAENYIGFNQHFGLAIGRGSRNVVASQNSFQANGQRAIDWEFDGLPTEDPAPIPEIVSVRVEDGRTMIEGFLPYPKSWGRRPRIVFFANDAADVTGSGEGQYFLGEDANGYFTIEGFRTTLHWPADLRGKWVTAVAVTSPYSPGDGGAPGDPTQFDWDAVTSEFSRAVEVK